jgi:hypothetical protein
MRRGRNEFTRWLSGSHWQQDVFDGFEVTESLPIPRRTGAFAAMENMPSGALSESERPFHPANPNAAGVPTS